MQPTSHTRALTTAALTALLFALAITALRATPMHAQDTAPAAAVYLPLIMGDSAPTAPPTPQPTPKPTPTQPACASSNRQYDLEVMRLINVERQKHGLPALTEDPALTLSACRHSWDMANHAFVGHVGSDGSPSGDRMLAAGYIGSPVGEILGSGFQTPQQMVNDWISSASHHAIMLSVDATDFGVAYAYDPSGPSRRWTVDFGKR